MLYHMQWYIICQHANIVSYVMDTGDELTFVW